MSHEHEPNDPHAWREALATWSTEVDSPRRLLQVLAETMWLDWESAVDQQQAVRDRLVRAGCPSALLSVDCWAEIEEEQ